MTSFWSHALGLSSRTPPMDQHEYSNTSCRVDFRVIVNKPSYEEKAVTALISLVPFSRRLTCKEGLYPGSKRDQPRPTVDPRTQTIHSTRSVTQYDQVLDVARM
ncbi:hypothetical protein Bbelb_438770 [Branchiostoma belcheri]|nr:hypothetical protein Bbelb_438770 [Branchiostoma belcheri]